MPAANERILGAALAHGRCEMGEVVILAEESGYRLLHREDISRTDLRSLEFPNELMVMTRCDEAGGYRPLRSAPNLAHGWQVKLATPGEVEHALETIYPGRLQIFVTWISGGLTTTPLRETLGRQTGIYRIAAKVSDEQIDAVTSELCRSDGGCLRTILWRRDANGALPSKQLPPEKFAPPQKQAGALLPLLCQEACTLVVGNCREIVKTATT